MPSKPMGVCDEDGLPLTPQHWREYHMPQADEDECVSGGPLTCATHDSFWASNQPKCEVALADG